MVFSSPIFIFLFLPITFLLFQIADKQHKNGILLSASLFFYAWGETLFVFVLLASILINFMFGIWIENAGKRTSSLFILIIIIALNLFLIGYFKYCNFLGDNINYILSLVGLNKIEVSSAVLPLGISFFTFQNISYVMDVFRGQIKAERNPFHYALYVSFFPHLIAGPIVRYVDIVVDIKSTVTNYPHIVSGIKRFIIGLSKKVLIANTLGWVADEIFKIPTNDLTTPLAWLGIIVYSFQIYFDFSGYSDMAIGLSRIFGFNFKENFNYPYIAKSVTEFWRRWHISLSNWFRDYLYIPLGGNRKGNIRLYFNLLLVFLCTGLWHGASWNFIVWAMIHGFFIVLERIVGDKRIEKIVKPIRHGYLIFILLISWVFFRIEELPNAVLYIKTLFGMNTVLVYKYSIWQYYSPELAVTLVLSAILSTPLLKNIYERIKLKYKIGEGAILVTYLLLLVLSVSGLAIGTYNPFIYFRF